MQSIPPSVPNPDKKVPGLFPSLTIRQWNAAVDELSHCSDAEVLEVRYAIRDYLVKSGYRRSEAV